MSVHVCRQRENVCVRTRVHESKQKRRLVFVGKCCSRACFCWAFSFLFSKSAGAHMITWEVLAKWFNLLRSRHWKESRLVVRFISLKDSSCLWEGHDLLFLRLWKLWTIMNSFSYKIKTEIPEVRLYSVCLPRCRRRPSITERLPVITDREWVSGGYKVDRNGSSSWTQSTGVSCQQLTVALRLGLVWFVTTANVKSDMIGPERKSRLSENKNFTSCGR